ncbi:MmpS family transport accessory protein [Mycolicibacterium mengxianglii]|uniref:MmpS family transport accessory protein n=1 Tax=Mycolicibacterium mengxianglii TaxID=2736649 RepID=UPI0018D0057A|nr:MmpS family transport accessory protein [Mycolicibacterium mengxianglii]
MSDPRRPDGSDPYRRGWSQPTEPMGDRNARYSDPAYAGQYTYPSHLPPNPTEQLPPYWTQTQHPQHQHPGQPPEPPRSPRWLWLAAGAAVLLVVGLVIALVITDTNDNQDTVVAPLPPMQQEPTGTTPPTTTSRRPTITSTPSTAPSTTPSTSVPLVPPTTGTPGVTETVVYTVSGEGRAISITYVDSGGVLQMEFNVVLPWTKEVSLASPASRAASVTVLNVGREVTCTVSVDGTPVRERTGSGLTICASAG